MSNLTPWFRGSVKPARKGVYLRDHISWGESFSLWDGKWWMYPGYTVAEAARQDCLSDQQNAPWRGLATNPTTSHGGISNGGEQ